MGASPAAAEPAVGVLQGTNSVAVFDTAAPGTTLGTVQVSGLAPGEQLAGVDYRYLPIAAPEQAPPPPQLFGLGVVDGGPTDTVRLYSIDLLAGVATPVGTGFAVLAGGTHYGIDFNPAVDRVRVVNDMDENLRINPNTGGLAGDDSNLNPAGGQVSAVAYDRVHVPAPPTGPVTAYAISVPSASLVTIGGIDAVPTANGGQLLNPKPLGVAMSAGNPADIDISFGGAAYAVLVDAATGQTGLFSVDLNTGAAAALGRLPGPLSGFALVPQSALPQFPVADTTAPTIALAGVRAKMSLAAFLKGVSAKVTPSEPASLRGELLGAGRKAKSKRGLASFTRVLARASLPLAAGRRTLKLRPKRKRVGRPATAFRVRVRITATDAAGNAATATRTIKVNPPKKKRKAG